MSELVIGGHLYECNLNRKYRICVHYKDDIYAILNLCVSRDGSLYISYPLINAEIKSFHGELKASNGSINYKYGQGKEITETVQNPKKVSYHASGAINLADGLIRHYSQSIRNITEQTEIIKLVFQHPTNFTRLQKNNLSESRDIILPIQFQDNLPVAGFITAAKAGYEKWVDSPSFTNSFNAMLTYEGIKLSKESDEQDKIIFQLVVYTVNKAEWAKESVMLILKQAKTDV